MDGAGTPHLFNFFDLFDFALELKSCELRGLTGDGRKMRQRTERNPRNLWTIEKEGIYRKVESAEEVFIHIAQNLSRISHSFLEI
jgi:hypothetical protein